MQFTTQVHIPPFSKKIGYQDRILMLGSCFSDEISARLQEHYFRVTANPYGTLYNPLSIADAILNTDSIELVEHAGLWHSFRHHGSFSSPDYDTTMRQCLEAMHTLQTAWQDASVVIITFGSAYVYEIADSNPDSALYPLNGQVVANCHKFPANSFVRRRLTVEDIVQVWRPILRQHADKHFIFTVSPIRHLGDGLHENQLSKAILLQAVDALVSSSSAIAEPSVIAEPDSRGASLALSERSERFGERVPRSGGIGASYFPSYEILLDELRDYRFYADDMLHPSRQAVSYIFERFVEATMDEATRRDMSALHSLWQDEHHTLLHPDSPESQAFLHSINKKRATLVTRFPWI